MFEFNYKKNNNNNLFKDLSDESYTNLKNGQNYIPLYSTFFSLNDKNWNTINLNNSKIITGINSKVSENKYTIQLRNGKLATSFFKFSPLIDPIKYMYGKYRRQPVETIMHVPTLTDVMNDTNNTVYERIIRKNNVSYVDGFFYYLSSKLKYEHGFINGTEFYGSFLGMKHNFQINIYDDIDYLTESDFFYENIDTLFTVDDRMHDILNDTSRKNKRTLLITENQSEEVDSHNISIDTIDNIDELNELFDVETESDNNIVNLNEIQLSDAELIFEFDLPNKQANINDNEADPSCNIQTSIKSRSISDDSSISSNSEGSTSTYLEIHNEEDNEIGSEREKEGCDGDDDEEDEEGDEEGEDNDNEEDEEDEDDDDDYSTTTDENITATIYTIPSQVICIENMSETLDSYMNAQDVCEDEWKSILAQVIFTLISYQRAFDFTHNDLHTNNIMYVATDIDYIYYKYKQEYYKIPTYGKIWKIIDYGRAIYTFKGKQIVSDSYHKNEDAGTQYNFAPYYNPKKPLVEPNKAFDLSRLGCSLFDYFIDSIEEVKDCDDELSILISEWCTDDNGSNMLYKPNGKERYPGFKLYKMIARNVHKHTPESQLSRPFFNSMKTKRRNVNKSHTVIDIDRIPSYIRP